MKDQLDKALADVLGPDPLRNSLSEMVEKTAQVNDRRVSDFEAGYRAAMAELQPQVQKLASAAVEKVTQEEHARRTELAQFEGEVAVHAAMAALSSFKTSMAAGKCWDCGVRPVSRASTMQRCTACDDMDS